MDQSSKISNDTQGTKCPLQIAIIGGSLAGLTCGVALKHAGHNVTILERDNDERQSHMAGVCLGLDATIWLEQHDRHTQAFSHRSTRIQLLKKDGSFRIFGNSRREITSWDTWYSRLRSTFDGLVSSYYPRPVESVDGDGLATFRSCNKVVQLEREGDHMLLKILDHRTSTVSQMHADLVIGADGPDSMVRAKYLPDVRRKYAGYIAWRGTVLACRVSESTRHLFRRSVTVHMTQRHHCIVYTIPGEDGSLDADKKMLNFLWYTNETPEAVEEIMKDKYDGHRHHNIVPAGHLRKDIWATLLERARTSFPEAMLEIVTEIEEPFVQIITDFCSPRASFEDGRVLLVGDAASLFRPHTAFSGTQAAFHALLVQDLVAGKISLGEWEERALRYQKLHWSQSIWWGEFYQSHILWALLLGLRYWFYCGLDHLKSWWNDSAPLLRTGSRTVEEYDSE